MSKLPALTAKKIIRALEKAQFVKDRQKGSHVIMVHLYKNIRTVVPIHAGKTIKKSLLRGIIQDTQLSVEEFLKLF